MERINRLIENHRVLTSILLAPFLALFFIVWLCGSVVEQIYMKLLGFDWDRSYWGYLNEKTGERKRTQPY